MSRFFAFFSRCALVDKCDELGSAVAKTSFAGKLGLTVIVGNWLGTGSFLETGSLACKEETVSFLACVGFFTMSRTELGNDGEGWVPAGLPVPMINGGTALAGGDSTCVAPPASVDAIASVPTIKAGVHTNCVCVTRCLPLGGFRCLPGPMSILSSFRCSEQF